MNIVDFENLYVSYENELVLKAINLQIAQGEHLAILGANGSGKSTLIKVISSELHPIKKYEHKKLIMGKERYSIFELKKHLGIITNNLHNYFELRAPYLTGYETVLCGYYSSVGVFTHQDFSDEQREKASEVMKFLEISHLKEKLVSQMSTGELRRCIIGRALIHEPNAFILDEPTVGLDIKAQNEFLKLIKKLSIKATIIIVTHHIEEIIDEIINIALIKNGEIIKQGKKEEILTSQNLSLTFDTNIEIDENNGRYFIKSVG